MRHEERAAFVAFQNHGVIADVIAGEKSQQHNVWRELPDILGERKEFLRRAVAVHSEIHYLYSFEPAIAAVRKAGQHLSKRPMEQLTGGVLLGDLLSFNKRIAQHCNPERAGGLSARPIGSAIAPSIHADQGTSLVSLPS